MAKVTEIVAELAAPAIAAAGCELWDVEYVREAGEWFLRLYLDKEGGVDIQDCEAVSRVVHRGQLYLRGVLRRSGAGPQAARRLPALYGQPCSGKALQGPGRPQGVPRLSGEL